MDELRDRLDVRVVGARNLLEVEGGPASPYLDVILGQDREVTSIQVRKFVFFVAFSSWAFERFMHPSGM